MLDVFTFPVLYIQNWRDDCGTLCVFIYSCI